MYFFEEKLSEDINFSDVKFISEFFSEKKYVLNINTPDSL